MKNRVTLDDMPDVPIGVLATIGPEQLAMLIDEINERAEWLKRARDWIEGAIALRYEGEAAAARQTLGKDTGTVHLNDEGYDVAITIAKRVKWNQEKVREALDKLAAAGTDPNHYAKLEIKIDERRYDAAPPQIQQVLAPARTVEHGKPSYKLKRLEAEAA